uniref:Uncharacterized protein n=1 Tax=Arundo donax TaxID=35708 RepID=A0A0A9C561_ARUDO
MQSASGNKIMRYSTTSDLMQETERVLTTAAKELQLQA